MAKDPKLLYRPGKLVPGKRYLLRTRKSPGWDRNLKGVVMVDYSASAVFVVVSLEGDKRRFRVARDDIFSSTRD